MCIRLRSYNFKFNNVVELTALKQNFILDVRAMVEDQFREQLPNPFDYYIDLMLFTVG